MKRSTVLVLALMSAPCLAGSYTANHPSTVTWVKIYNNDTIYFGLESMPTDHQCTGNFFALSPALTDKQRDRYYAMLLTAKLSGVSVTVGYDNAGPDCFNTRPVAHALVYQ